VQPIGGVTRKIEGFFEICRHKGLNGKQGVMIPEKNVNNLMLRRDVVEAVEKGKFHIYPVTTVEEGIEILTGMEAGQLQEDGTYPEGTLYNKVDEKLQEMAEVEKEFGKSKEEEEGKDEENNENAE
jgi:predicted ATP-dependent protease